jgi:hypothetical protein
MNKMLKPMMFVCLTVAAAHQSSAQEMNACNVGNLKEGYGFSVKGRNVPLAADFIITGRFSADGRGNFTGFGKESVNGTVDGVQFSGTYTVDPDCTGSGILVFPKSQIRISLYFVIVENGDELIILNDGPGSLESGYAKKQFIQKIHH